MVNSCLTAWAEDAVQQSSGHRSRSRPAGGRVAEPATSAAAFLQQFHRALITWPRAAWKPGRFMAYLTIRKVKVDGMKIRERAGKTAVAFLVLSLGALVSGCMMTQTAEPTSETQFTARDKKL